MNAAKAFTNNIQRHGISFVEVDNKPLQQAISDGAHSDRIVALKANVSFNATIGYQYDEVPFSSLAAILSNDYAFNPFKFKNLEEGATYNAKAFPEPYGRIRGKANVTGKCTWVCLDIDDTSVSDEEYHKILGNINHHIARTSNPNNPYKYRVIIPLTKAIDIDNDHWKFFIGSISKAIHCKIDRLPKSQLLIGYLNRTVHSVTDGNNLDPTPHLTMAKLQVAELKEKQAQYTPGQASKALQQPYTTFEYAFNAEVGNRWATSHAAIHKAKELGASSDYIKELMYKINDFLDVPKSREVVRASLFSAI